MSDPRDIDPRPEPADPSEPAPAAGASTPPPAAGTAPPPGDTPPTQQEVAIRAALETVVDPEIGLSVIDLGLIREITLGSGRTLIRMMLTTPFCPYAPQMVAEVKAAAESVVPQETEVELLPDPWSPEMMPDPGLLGFSF